MSVAPNWVAILRSVIDFPKFFASRFLIAFDVLVGKFRPWAYVLIKSGEYSLMAFYQMRSECKVSRTRRDHLI